MTDLPITVISRDEVEIGNRRLSREEITQFSQPRPSTASYIAEVVGWREILRLMDAFEEPKPKSRRNRGWDLGCVGGQSSDIKPTEPKPTWEPPQEEPPFSGPWWDELKRYAKTEGMDDCFAPCVHDLRESIERLMKGAGK